MAKIIYYTFNPYTQYIAILDTKDSYVYIIWKTLSYMYNFKLGTELSRIAIYIAILGI